jgi:hypothetical protein
VQAALIAANYNPYLRNFYERVKARRGAGRAIIALARKFLDIIYRTLKNKWVFEDFSNFVLGGERMTPLWALLPGIQASGSGCAARPWTANSRTVLGVKGLLRRGLHRRALDSCAPFCRAGICDGRLRREPEAVQVLRLTETRTDGSRQTS